MSKISLGKYKKRRKNSKLVVYEKVKKEYIEEAILLLSLPVNSDAVLGLTVQFNWIPKNL